MCLRIRSLYSVELGESTTATFDGQPQCFQPTPERPSCCIDGCGILERGFGGALDLFQEIRLFCQEHGYILSAFLLVARFTGQREIADAIRSPFSARDNMLNLKRGLLLPTIRTLSLPLFEQVFTQLVACQGALLVLQTRYFRVLHLLQVKL